MSYVPRRIQIVNKDGKTETISDQEFSRLDAPLVLLGEPGAGKTETAHAISAVRQGTYVTAFSVISGAPSPLFSQNNPVIDGLDEVRASTSEQPLVAILRRLNELGVRSFAVTCRAAAAFCTEKENRGKERREGPSEKEANSLRRRGW
jgi:hypothetical protein